MGKNASHAKHIRPPEFCKLSNYMYGQPICSIMAVLQKQTYHWQFGSHKFSKCSLLLVLWLFVRKLEYDNICVWGARSASELFASLTQLVWCIVLIMLIWMKLVFSEANVNLILISFHFIMKFSWRTFTISAITDITGEHTSWSSVFPWILNL